jgi:protein SCO1/2
LYVVGPLSKLTLTLASVLLAFMASAGCQRAQSDERAAAVGAPAGLAAVALTDHEGRARRFADFRGKTVVFSFFFTSCPTICPREAKALSELQRRLSPALGERVRFVSLSVDPENDTPEAMREFAFENGADLKSWSFVRASEPATRALALELSMFEGPEKAQAAPSNHTTAVYLFDATGRLRQRYAGSPLDVPRLAREIERLDAWISETSRSAPKAAAVEQVTALK